MNQMKPSLPVSLSLEELALVTGGITYGGFWGWKKTPKHPPPRSPRGNHPR
jgi:hypothetical protein